MEGRRDERTVSIRASCRPLLERRQRAGPGFGSVAWVLVVVIYPEQWLSVVGRCTASGCGFGLALARGAPPFLGRGLADEADDGVVVVAVGLRSVTASGVVGVTVGVFLGCPGPAVAVAPERHPVDAAENAAGLSSLGGRLLLGSWGRRAIAERVC
jgi:hypothetical protein